MIKKEMIVLDIAEKYTETDSSFHEYDSFFVNAYYVITRLIRLRI